MMISVVIPCYDEEEVLEPLFEALSAEAAKWGEPYEVILVDDGSTDGTWARIGEIHGRDDRWKGVRLARNFGHQAAITAGLAHAGGDAVAVMDADLQDPPAVIARFIEKWREGHQVVYGIRRKRREGLLLRAAYRIFYRLLRRASPTPIPLDAGDFCLLDRKAVDLLAAMPEQNRFVRGMRAWVGFRQTGVEYDRAPRAAGATHYSTGQLVQLAVDGIFSFSTVPLRLVTRLGLLVSFCAFLGMVFTFIQKVFAEWFARHGMPHVPGFYTTLIAVLFLGGIQLVCLGIVGEYVGRIYDEVKRRPLWVVSEGLGVEQAAGRRAPAAGAPVETGDG